MSERFVCVLTWRYINIVYTLFVLSCVKAWFRVITQEGQHPLTGQRAAKVR